MSDEHVTGDAENVIHVDVDDNGNTRALVARDGNLSIELTGADDDHTAE